LFNIEEVSVFFSSVRERVFFVRISVFQSQKEIPNQLVQLAGYNIITMENRVGALEKAVDVHGEKLTE